MIKHFANTFWRAVGRHLIQTCCVTLLFFILPVFSKPLLPIQHWLSRNNVPVYFVPETQQPMLDVAVAFHAGSIYDGKQYGLANLTAQMLKEGAGNQTAEQVAESFDNIGAQFSVGVDKGMAVFNLRALTDPTSLQTALSTLHLLLTKATFPQAALDRLKQRTFVGLQANQQSPSAVVSKIFLKTLYGNSPYAHLTAGEADTVKTVMRTNLKKFYRQYYVASNAFIVLVGDVSLAEAKNITEQLLKGMPEGKPAKPTQAKVLPHEAETKNINMLVPQTAILIGNVAIARNNGAYFPLMLGNYILGAGMSSRLFKIVREQQGLSYNVSSGFLTWEIPGPFLINLQTKNQSAKQAITSVKDVVGQYVKQGPTEQELKAAKQYLSNGLAMQFSTNNDILSAVINLAYYGLPLNYYDRYLRKINAVTQKQITQAFKQYVNPKEFVVVSVGG